MRGARQELKGWWKLKGKSVAGKKRIEGNKIPEKITTGPGHWKNSRQLSKLKHGEFQTDHCQGLKNPDTYGCLSIVMPAAARTKNPNFLALFKNSSTFRAKCLATRPAQELSMAM